jgi:hypothetical protein
MSATSMRWLRCASRCSQKGNPTHDMKPFPQTPFNSQSHSARWRLSSCWSHSIREHLVSFVRKTATRNTLVGSLANHIRKTTFTRANTAVWYSPQLVGTMPGLRRSKDGFPRIHLLPRGLAKRRSWWMPVDSAWTHASDWQQIMPFVPLPWGRPGTSFYIALVITVRHIDYGSAHSKDAMLRNEGLRY